MTEENKQPAKGPKILVEDKTKSSDKPTEKEILNLKLDIERIKKYEVPSVVGEKLLSVWKDDGSDMTEAYVELFDSSMIIARFLAISCNDGAEVNESISKRMILAKMILTEFMHNLALNGWMMYGLLSELQHDFYQDISGSQKTIDLLKKINKLASKKAEAKAKSYVA